MVGGTAHNVVYGFNASLNDCTWAEISSISRAGMAQQVFSVGDEKTTQIAFFDGSTNNKNYSVTKSLRSASVVITGINTEASNSITFISRGYPIHVTATMDSVIEDGWPEYVGYDKLSVSSFISSHASEIFPEAYSYIRSMSLQHWILNPFDPDKYTTYPKSGRMSAMVWPPAGDETGCNRGYYVEDGGNLFPLFSTYSRKNLDGTGKGWVTRSAESWAAGSDGEGGYTEERAGFKGFSDNQYQSSSVYNVLDMETEKFYMPLCFLI